MSAVEELQKVGFADAITVEACCRTRAFAMACVAVSSSSTSLAWSLPVKWQTYSGSQKNVHCGWSSAETPNKSEVWRQAMLCECWKRNLG